MAAPLSLYQQCVVFMEEKVTIMFIISGYSFLDLGLENIDASLTNFMRILGNLLAIVQ